MDNIEKYKKYIHRKSLFILVLAIATILTALYAISAGSSGLSIKQVILALVGRGTEQAKIVVWNIRMPRVLTAVAGGIGLASVGCAMQSILKNPLASASTLGISQGAAFGASFAIVVLGAGLQSTSGGDSVTFTNVYLITICAFICSMASTFIVLGLSKFISISPESMILTGVALSSLFGGATTLMQYFANDIRLAAVVFWTFGDLGRTSWREVLIIITVSLTSFIYFMFNRWNFNALQNGEETAKGIGVNVEKMRLTGMFVCSLTASVIVSFVGIINFIGLIAPHLVRRFIGGDYRFLLPASALTGALLLLLSDCFARLAVAPIIMPIGAITSFLGAPLFLYLLFRGSNK